MFTDYFLNADDADWADFRGFLSVMIRLICVICVLFYVWNADDADWADLRGFFCFTEFHGVWHGVSQRFYISQCYTVFDTE